MKPFALLVVLLLFAAPLAAQDVEEEEEAEPGDAPVTATVTGDVRMHAGPSTGAAVGTLATGTTVEIIGTANGWMRVRTPDGKVWVDRRFLKTDEATLTPSAFAIAPMAAAKKAGCATSLGKCTDIGCAEEGTSHALLNAAKHGPPTGSLRKLTFAQFAALQDAAMKLVGEGAQLDEEDRKTIRKLKVGSQTLGEGTLASIVGFISGKPHPNSGESVNCGLGGLANNDIHISIVPEAGDEEFDGIVVEMIPQDRPSQWTPTALGKVAKAEQKVMVVGQLFYDSVHRVNKNAKKPIGGQPKRMSLWELHPVTEFFVCTEDDCTASSKKGWTKLEDL
ncbi:MAG TPA: SH3 domain-containing protein [Thermoanaerobaculia bacterium]|nr:SH3 domain-containing protein [Thermoanaerobaculia bacterium]